MRFYYRITSPTLKIFLSGILLLLLLFDCIISSSQTGMYFFTNHKPREYDAEAQNWSIIQDHRGIMYFGNTSGLLEYDGTDWRLIKLPNNLGVRSLGIDSKGNIYVGSLDELGYIAPDSLGKMEYVSLLPKIDTSCRQFADVWKVHCIGNKVVFQTFPSLIILENDSIKVIKSKTNYRLSFSVYNHVYVSEEKSGVKLLNGDSLVLIPGGEKLKNIATMLPYGKDENVNDLILIPQNWDMGINIFNGKELQSIDCPAYKYLSDNMMYNSCVVDDKNYLIGTIRGGGVLMDRSCSIMNIFNKSRGLIDDMIFCSYLDNQNGLWLGFNNGISRIEVLTPVTNFGEFFGLEADVSSIESIVRFNGQIYVATNQGIFILKNQDNNSNQKSITASGVPNDILYRFEPVKKMDSQAWSLLIVGNTLFAATNRAVYKLENNKIDSIYNGRSYCLYRSMLDTLRIYFGMPNGLATLYNDHGKWINEGKVENVREQIHSICELHDSSLWLGTLYQGIIQVKFPKKRKYISRMNEENKLQVEIKTETINHYDTTYGLPDGEIGVFLCGDKIGIATSKGLYRINESFNQKKYSFFPDTLMGINSQFGFPEITRIVTEKNGNLWFNVNGLTVNAIKGKNGKFEFISKPFMRIHGNSWAFYPENNGITWIGGEDGLFRYDSSVSFFDSISFATNIRKTTIQSGANFLKNIYNLQDTTLSLPYRTYTIGFEFTLPEYREPEKILYQYKISQIEEEWSPLSKKNFKEFTLMKEGKYTFNFKGKNVYGQESKIRECTIIVLPPWYRTLWAYSGYIISLISLIYLFISYRTRSLKKEKKNLEEIVQKRTEEVIHQKEIIEEKNKNIEDSISYASHIQSGILPPIRILKNFAPESFILFLPRDIVSGDFYWFSDINQLKDIDTNHNEIIIATIDCTGHGVPASLLSMIVNEKLNYLVNEKNIFQPYEILNQLHIEIRKTLNIPLDENEGENGMDMSICRINISNMWIEYAGAFNSLFIFNKTRTSWPTFAKSIKDIEFGMEIPADKMSICRGEGDKFRQFTHYKFGLCQGDTLYLFSDGFQDQLGGPKDKRYFKSRFRKLLSEIHDESMDKQKEILLKSHLDWKGETWQTDDILVVGIKII